MNKSICYLIVFCIVLVSLPVVSGEPETINTTQENDTSSPNEGNRTVNLTVGNETALDVSANDTDSRYNHTVIASDNVSNNTNNRTLPLIQLDLATRMKENTLYYRFLLNQTGLSNITPSCTLTYWIESQNRSILRKPYTTESLSEKQYTITSEQFSRANETETYQTVLFIRANMSCLHMSEEQVTRLFSVCINTTNETFESILCKANQSRRNLSHNKSAPNANETLINQTVPQDNTTGSMQNETVQQTKQQNNERNRTESQKDETKETEGSDTTKKLSDGDDNKRPSTFEINTLSLDEDNQILFLESSVYKNTTAKYTLYYEVTAAGLHLSDTTKEKLYDKETAYQFSHTIPLRDNQLFCSRLKTKTIQSDVPLVLEIRGLGFEKDYELKSTVQFWHALCNLEPLPNEEPAQKESLQEEDAKKNEQEVKSPETASASKEAKTQQIVTTGKESKPRQFDVETDMRNDNIKQTYQTKEHALYGYLGYLVVFIAILLVVVILII
jgi:hypothetical protein